MSFILQFLLTALLSAAAGMAVGLPIILNESAPLMDNLLKSGIAGCLIGIIANLTASLIFRIIYSHTFWAFFAVIIVIAAGTGLGGYLSGLVKIQHYISVIAGGEIIGIILTCVLNRYSKKLNNKLKAAKEKYEIK